MNHFRTSFATLTAVAAVGLAVAQTPQRAWLAGDSHVHSHWSPGYDRTKNPPEPILGADAIYSTPVNAQQARQYGLSWMVTTDHGGPNHSKLNLIHAYAELKESRKLVSEVLQFYGLELNMPAMDHHTLIMPNTEDEWQELFNIESQFDANESWPPDPTRNTDAMGLRALAFMKTMRRLPLMFANHPSRSATGVGVYGLDQPREFRNNNDLAPDIYHGMEGAPGHQAGGLEPDGSQKRGADGTPSGDRGAYGHDGARTFGGFDQMTAIVGGLWDALLGEGRRFWIVATSDSHANFADTAKPGSDFWPGQYQKTYVWASRSYDDILDGLRGGRIFAVAGDLINELDVVAESGGSRAEMGETLNAVAGADVKVTIRFNVPASPNANGEHPVVRRVDLIVGDVRGPAESRDLDKNETAKVAARFTANDWVRHGTVHTMSTTLLKTTRPTYLRVRGTSTDELEPSMDPKGENPWSDLWFYANPIFVSVR